MGADDASGRQEFLGIVPQKRACLAVAAPAELRADAKASGSPFPSETLTGTGFQREIPSFPRVVFPFMGSHSGAPAEGEQRVPVEQVLNGLEVHALEPGETALEAFILLKVLDRDGDVAWSYRTTNRLSREELLGALTVQVDVLRKSLRDEWADD
jgi:hypothetical protein